ncbi:hypothetical protein [Priestia megaterium]|uniref:hypothetical protein n=1 Tax=Priestia megaterium TaxID=1404 RepID=UPI0023DC4A8D|nr:hypothetical protein [Priestia megaterium]MDF2010198.1 hypothetical protein [Priestia megaterium]
MGSSSILQVNFVKNRFSQYSRQAQAVYKKSLNEIMDDLVRTSSASAPHKSGTLEQSWSKELYNYGSQPYGLVSYSATSRGRSGNFNYAMKMHEGGYSLGEGSRRKSGGTGMSGKHYPVGANYLGGVLMGEQQAYKQHIEDALRNFSNRF